MNTQYTAAFVLSFLCLNFLLLYCYYYSVMYGTVMPVSAYMALAFVFGFIQINNDDDDELSKNTPAILAP